MSGLSTLAGSRPAAHAGTSAIARRRTIARAMLAATAVALLLAMLAACCIGAY
ncbi:iron ABC transporter permease, partial [Burkholderia sp. Tr-860]|nr:iron ABC transporter permease [Burkholderia sp. Tr-860]